MTTSTSEPEFVDYNFSTTTLDDIISSTLTSLNKSSMELSKENIRIINELTTQKSNIADILYQSKESNTTTTTGENGETKTVFKDKTVYNDDKIDLMKNIYDFIAYVHKSNITSNVVSESEIIVQLLEPKLRLLECLKDINFNKYFELLFNSQSQIKLFVDNFIVPSGFITFIDIVEYIYFHNNIDLFKIFIQAVSVFVENNYNDFANIKFKVRDQVLTVPLITLINLPNLVVDEAKIDMKLELQYMKNINGTKVIKARPSSDNRISRSNNTNGTMNITIKVASRPMPETLNKIYDVINNTL